nr:reverse transcriptase domain-containing protein [Tanacetum cinerariifolium]
LRVNDESITFNLNQTMRYSSTYDDTSVNRVDVIDVVCEDFVQDVLDFEYNPKSSNPTLVSDDLISESDSSKVPIVKSSSLTVTPFEESDFVLKEIEDFLNDDSIPTGIEKSVYDPDGDILFLEKLVNDESITFNLNQTMRYSSTYDDTLVNRVDVIDVVCEDFVQDVLDFEYNPKSSNPSLVFGDLISESDSSKVPIVKSSSLTVTPFEESDFVLEEIEDFLNDDSIPTGIEKSVYDPDEDILFLEKLLNEDLFQLLLMELKLA